MLINGHNSSPVNINFSLSDTKDWVLRNRLKMNDEKTEFIVFCSRQSLAKCNVSEIAVGDCLVSRSSVVKLLRVEIDDNLCSSIND